MVEINAQNEEELQKYYSSNKCAFVTTFIRDYNTGQPVEPNTFQRELLNSEYRYNVLRVHRRSGKCQLESDRAYLADGTVTTWGELVGKSFELLSIKDGEIKPVKAFAFYNATEEVYEIETDSGRIITRNGDHPLFKGESKSFIKSKPEILSKGWTPTRNLVPGDLLAAPILLPFDLPGLSLSDSEIKLIAYLIGDGCLTQPDQISFSQEDNSQLSEMRDICSDLSITLRHDSNYDYSLNGNDKKSQNPALHITRKYNLQGKGSFEKSVPKEFFQLSLPQLRTFLSLLYSTDGWASLRKEKSEGRLRGSGEIGYSSVSKQLIDDIQHLLLRFGINSRIYKKVSSYTLAIDNFEDIINFVEKIGIFGKEEACQKVYIQSLRLKDKKYGKAESLSWENGSLIKKYQDKRKLRSGEVGNLNRKIDVTPWRLKEAPEHCRWERIVRITKISNKRTVAVSVPDTNTFLTDFYEHNTFGMLLIALFECCTREGGNILFVAPRMSQVEKFFDELDKFLEANSWIKIRRSSKRPHKKVFGNGCTLRGFTTGASSQGRGTALRGQEADVVLLDELAYIADGDYNGAIAPIIEGDAYRKVDTIAYAASTPTSASGTFYKLCMDKKLGWKQFKMSVTENPDWTPEKVKRARLRSTEREWLIEWMVEFLDVGDSVFARSLVEAAQRVYPERNTDPGKWRYFIPGTYPLPHPVKVFAGRPPVKRIWRTMGVDWDVKNRDGSGPNLVVLECDETGDPSSNPFWGKIRVIYRESILQQEYTLTKAVERIKQINHALRPDSIYVDYGMGYNQVETLHLEGQRNPTSRLKEIVRGINFGSIIECPDPTGAPIKKRFKPFMVNLMVYLFEQGEFIFSKKDSPFFNQLVEYKIVSVSIDGTPKYTSVNEHIIDAAGLAAVAMWVLHKSPFQRKVATKSYLLPAPEVIAAENLSSEDLLTQHPVVRKVLSAKVDQVRRDPLAPRYQYDNLPPLGMDGPVKDRPTTSGDLFRNSLVLRHFERRTFGTSGRSPTRRSRF